MITEVRRSYLCATAVSAQRETSGRAMPALVGKVTTVSGMLSRALNKSSTYKISKIVL